jgi:ABC-type uncharacterized transport system ATPase subunit
MAMGAQVSAASGHSPALEVVGITKRFPGVVACDHIDLAISPGSTHAIVGENGAGKSTLMSILYGLLPPDEGKIIVGGEERQFSSPLDGMAAGLGMVFQAFKQFPSLTAAENVVYNEEPTTGRLVLDRRAANNHVAELGERYGLAVNPATRIENLSVGERQRVEILKALYRDAQILILDEPTAVLTPQETDLLFDVLRRLRDDGRTIVFVTHKLREVMKISDEVTVLRRGRVVATRDTSATDPTELSADMTGRSIDLSQRPSEHDPEETVLELASVTVLDGEGNPAVADVSLQVRAGEVVGIAAIAGNGQEQLMAAIAGLAPTSSGSVLVGGTAIEAMTVERRRDAFVAYIPEDRHGTGSASDGSTSDNLLMGYQDQIGLSQRGWLKREAVREHASELIHRYDIVATASTMASELSGGNLQKVIVAREMGHQVPVLLAEQPTRGVDIGAIEFIHAQLVEYRNRGGAILLVSAELGELMTLSTRILVMYEGRVVAEFDPLTTTEAEIGLYMSGARDQSDND